MLLEFKRKSDALQLITMLGSINPAMENKQLSQVFGILQNDLEKIFSKKLCFGELSPAERLATDGECVVDKIDNCWIVDFPYEIPADDSEHEEDLYKTLEGICRNLAFKVKIRQRQKFRRKSEYLTQCEMLALLPENPRMRAKMVWVICRNDENRYNLEHSDEILRIFDEEIDAAVITDLNWGYIWDAVESLENFYFKGNTNDPEFKRYHDHLVKLKRYRGDEKPLPKPDTLQRFQLAFSSTSGVDIKSIIKVMETSFGFLSNDYFVFVIVKKPPLLERIKSDAELARTIRLLPKNKSVITKWRLSSPALYHAFASSLHQIIRQCRPDVASHMKVEEIAINHEGIHIRFWTSDMSDHPEFTQLVLDMLPTKMLTEALLAGAGLTPTITLLETKKM